MSQFKARWYGFVASQTRLAPPDSAAYPYCAVIRTSTGWSLEVAASATPRDWQAEARRLLNSEGNTASVLDDPARGIWRLAIHHEGILTGLLFAAPTPVMLARTHAVALIGTRTPAAQALAGRAPANQPDPGRTVCACFNVGLNTLCAAIRAGAHDISALGRATAAGTNCGACKPELAALIADARLKTAAE